ncbi:MAG: BatD family protein [Phycisphaerales bacterium]|nr:BatD family protein [Phycisphaerales bacterium]
MNIIRITRLCITLLVMTVCAVDALAQADEPVTIESRLSRERVYIGDDLTLQIIVRGADNPSQPIIDFPDSVIVKYHGRSSQSISSMRNINGRVRSVSERRLSYQYTLIAVETGTIIIPAPTVKAQGKLHTGNQSSFEVIYPVESDDDDLQMLISRDTIYLNESVEIECSWWIGAQTSDFSLSSSVLPESFEIHGLNPSVAGTQQVPFEINGQQIIGVVIEDFYMGKTMQRLVFSLSITPSELGSFDLGPLRAVFTRRAGTGQNYRAYVESNSVEIEVIAVPTENQPDGYTGAIGSVGLRTQASNTSVNVGDPITLTLEITAPEPMTGIDQAPSLSKSTDFVGQFKISSEGWREVRPRQPGRRVYETTIRATNDQVTQIPPIKVPSFHPASGQYRIYQSAPIELDVHPVQEITLSDAIITDQPRFTPSPESIERTELSRAMPGLWAHRSASAMLSESHFSLSKSLRDPLWITVLATGPSLFALSFVVFVARRSSDPQAQRLRIAWRASKPLARRGEHTQALRVYISNILEINTDSITADDAYKLAVCDNDAKLIAQCISQDEKTQYDQSTHINEEQSDCQAPNLKNIHSQIKRSLEGRS